MGPQFNTPVSFEFFPPRDESGRNKLAAGTAEKLAALQPSYFSVTYGAGGSTKEGTKQTVTDLTERGWQAVPHLSVGAADQAEVLDLVTYYKTLGVKKILCLRGDQTESESQNHQYAEDLVRLIRQHFGDYFEVVVGAYPEVHPDSPSSQDDLAFFKRKVDAALTSPSPNISTTLRRMSISSSNVKIWTLISQLFRALCRLPITPRCLDFLRKPVPTYRAGSIELWPNTKTPSKTLASSALRWSLACANGLSTLALQPCTFTR